MEILDRLGPVAWFSISPPLGRDKDTFASAPDQFTRFIDSFLSHPYLTISRTGLHTHFDDLQLERNYDTQRAYRQSKLANVLFTYELADRFDPSVTANALHPGVIPSTRLGRDSGLWSSLVYRFIGSLVGKTTEEGASIIAYLAASSDVEGTSGAYYVNGEPKPKSNNHHWNRTIRRYRNDSGKSALTSLMSHQH